MCLSLRKDSTKPHDNSHTRYKVVKSNKGRFNGKFAKLSFFAPYRNTQFAIKDWNVAKLNGKPHEEGFHVYIDKKDAENHRKENFYSYGVVKTVTVRGFLKSGTYYGANCETWKEMAFVD